MTNHTAERAPGAGLYQSHRARMVELLRTRGIQDPQVLKAMAEIPRHLFVPDALAAKAYGDHALPIGDMQTISQPYMVARMTERFADVLERVQLRLHLRAEQQQR